LEYFKEAREKYTNFEKDMSDIYKKLEKGNTEANGLADRKYEEMLKIAGL
jgi:Skp family chaperone for outer membrane proteins